MAPLEPAVLGDDPQPRQEESPPSEEPPSPPPAEPNPA